MLTTYGGGGGGASNLPSVKIWMWCIERDIWLSDYHIPGSTNVVTDTESRQINSWTEWSLNLNVFSDVDKLWGPFHVDLFASRLNSKVSSYVLWKPDAGAKYVESLLKIE